MGLSRTFWMSQRLFVSQALTADRNTTRTHLQNKHLTEGQRKTQWIKWVGTNQRWGNRWPEGLSHTVQFYRTCSRPGGSCVSETVNLSAALKDDLTVSSETCFTSRFLQNISTVTTCDSFRVRRWRDRGQISGDDLTSCLRSFESGCRLKNSSCNGASGAAGGREFSSSLVKPLTDKQTYSDFKRADVDSNLDHAPCWWMVGCAALSFVSMESSGSDLVHHDGQVQGRARVSVSQLEHQLLFFLRELLVHCCLPLQRHLQVMLLL